MRRAFMSQVLMKFDTMYLCTYVGTYVPYVCKRIRELFRQIIRFYIGRPVSERLRIKTR